MITRVFLTFPTPKLLTLALVTFQYVIPLNQSRSLTESIQFQITLTITAQNGRPYIQAQSVDCTFNHLVCIYYCCFYQPFPRMLKFMVALRNTYSPLFNIYSPRWIYNVVISLFHGFIDEQIKIAIRDAVAAEINGGVKSLQIMNPINLNR